MGELIPLVNITKSPSPPPETNIRLLRYQMQSVARHMLPNNRVKICLRYQREKYGTVDVFKHRQTQKAFYGGLMICGSVWICPVCAAKISERRKAELKNAASAHKDSGGYLTMLTLTFSHSKTDRLADLLESLGKVVQKFRSGKAYDKLRTQLGLIGSVRALEVTYGSNGWHPHIHLLNFHTREIEGYEQEEFQERFYNLWSAACEKYGMKTSYEHGLKLDDASEADQYIGKWGDLVERKWGVSSEMTKSNIKKGRSEESLTPFDFLRKVIEDGDLEYTTQFIEYAESMKGKTQLYWSRGLKQQFAIVDKTDEEIANSKEEPADLLGGLDWKDWRYILDNNLRAKLLDLVEENGYDDALNMIGIKRKAAAANSDSHHEALE